MSVLDIATANHFAAVALGHIRREYPNKLDHVLNGPEDLRSPSALHPVFYGSFDWHSNVHAYWLLATLRRRVPNLESGAAIDTLFAEQFTPRKVAGELAYLGAPNRALFERPYGWAWLLMLAAELYRQSENAHDRGAASYQAIQPLAQVFVDRFKAFLPKATYPIRVGTHFNSAFAATLAHEYAVTVGDETFADTLRQRASAWYSRDIDCQAWEPGGDDFLSSALIEAECLRRVIAPEAWRAWFDAFLPRLSIRQPATLFEPVTVSDRSDGKIAHLDGLNLSRAWCWRGIAASLPADDVRRRLARDTADAHLAASLPHVAGEYAGEHWLATFALLALRDE